MSMEIVERLFSTVERKDVDAYLACFTEDAEYKAGNFPAVFGHQAIREFAAQIIPLFNQVEHKVKNSWQNGDTIISEMDLVYHRKDGKVVTVPCVDIVQLENGKVKSLRAYLDASPAFAA
jgi:ketosteroid isomerase-like protein